MAFATYVAVNATKYKHPFGTEAFIVVIVVTASHNPPETNGIKLESLGKIEPINGAQLERVINDEKEFETFVNGLQGGS